MSKRVYISADYSENDGDRNAIKSNIIVEPLSGRNILPAKYNG